MPVLISSKFEVS